MMLNQSNHLTARQSIYARYVARTSIPPLTRRNLGFAFPLQGRATSRSGAQIVCSAAATKETPPLKTIVQGRNIKLTESLRDFAEEKVEKVLEKFAVSVKEVDVNLSVSKGKGGEKHKCEITVFMYRMGVVRAEDVEENMYAAIEKVSDTLARKMRKVKDKAIMKGKWEGRAGPRGTAHSTSAALPEEVSSDDDDFDTSGTAPYLAPEIVRTKALSLQPMSIHDAMDQAEQVGHPFYVFKDSDGTIKVLYKRQHRGYGVIVPK